jgi:hypothetical protein
VRTTTSLREGIYYQHRCRPDRSTLIPLTDVENYKVAVPLRRDDVVLCTGFVRRNGARYARLLHRRDENWPNVVLYVRASKKGNTSLHWTEMNPMLVVALAAKIHIH